MIYRYHLVLPKPEFIRVPPFEKWFLNTDIPGKPRILIKQYMQCHLHSCPIYKHKMRGEDFVCINPFSGEEKRIRPPPTMLSFPVVNKTIYKESIGLYYKYNNFMMENIHMIEYFIRNNPVAKRWLREITFRYRDPWGIRLSQNSNGFFLDCPNLRILHIKFKHHWVCKHRKEPLAKSYGMENFLRLRNIEVLDLCGTDLIWNENGESEVVDINHDLAFGPLLRQQLMQKCTWDKRKGRCPGCPVCPVASPKDLRKKSYPRRLRYIDTTTLWSD